MSWSYYDFLLIVGKGTLEIRSDWAAKNFNSSTVISGLFKSQTLNICFSCIGEYELFLINHAHNKGSYLLALGWEGKDIAFFFTVSRLLIYNIFFFFLQLLQFWLETIRCVIWWYRLGKKQRFAVRQILCRMSCHQLFLYGRRMEWISW